MSVRVRVYTGVEIRAVPSWTVPAHMLRAGQASSAQNGAARINPRLHLFYQSFRAVPCRAIPCQPSKWSKCKRGIRRLHADLRFVQQILGSEVCVHNSRFIAQKLGYEVCAAKSSDGLNPYFVHSIYIYLSTGKFMHFRVPTCTSQCKQ